MQQENTDKVVKSIPTIIWKIWTYLFFYMISFLIVLTIIGAVLSRFSFGNNKLIFPILWILSFIFITNQVVKIVTKKIVIIENDILSISIGTAAVLLVFQLVMNAIAYFNNGVLDMYAILQALVMDIILAVLFIFWFKKSSTNI